MMEFQADGGGGGGGGGGEEEDGVVVEVHVVLGLTPNHGSMYIII